MTARRALGGLLLAAGLLAGPVTAASAAPASATAGNYYQVEGYANATSSDVGLSYRANLSTGRTRIWIVPGSESCIVFGTGIVTWSGALGNGTFTLDAGCNYQGYGNDGVLHKYWIRLDAHADGSCTWRGDMLPFGLICRG